MTLGNYAEQNKPIHKGCILYDSIYVTFLKGQIRNGKQICGCWVFKEELEVKGGNGLHKGNVRDSCSDGNFLYLDSTRVNTLVVKHTINLQDISTGES